MYIYKEPLYRPPSEANSLIVQVTEGCSHNKCRFCYMYKDKQFRVKQYDELVEHLRILKRSYPNPRRVFLADGNVLCLKTDKLLKILDAVKSYFPSAERISSYSGPLDILRKTDGELRTVREAGLELLYMGVESGSDKVLDYMQKGADGNQMIEAGQKAKDAKFRLSCMIISGLGGKENMEDHAICSAKVISAINPDYFSLLRLVVEEESELMEDIREGRFHLLKPIEVIDENIMMLENVDLHDCIFRANHVSNHVNQAGTLNRDRNMLVERLKGFKTMSGFVPMTYDTL